VLVKRDAYYPLVGTSDDAQVPGLRGDSSGAESLTHTTSTRQ